MWGSGSYEPRNLGVGRLRMGEANPIMQFCFAMETLGWARHLFGNKDEPRTMGKGGQVLTSCDVSSLVVDWLCDQARGRDMAVACFYFDFAAHKEQSSASMLIAGIP